MAVAVSHAGFVLQDAAETAGSEAIQTELVSANDFTLVGVTKVLAAANRDTSKVSGVHNVPSSMFLTGYTWQSGDILTTSWTPQGITGSGDAMASSWYHKPSTGKIDKGVRVAFIDMVSNKYRFALLVKPSRAAGGTASYDPIPIHAGGMAWSGDFLYVADTYDGLRVFDLRRFLKPTTYNSDKDYVGLHDGQYFTAGYAFILPQSNHYVVAKESSELVFSFVSLGSTSGSAKVLMTGEYSTVMGGRLMQWALGNDSMPVLAGGKWTAGMSLDPVVKNMQGAAIDQDVIFISSSLSGNQTLYTRRPDGSMVGTGWPPYCEDLFIGLGGSLWGLTEVEGYRKIWAVNRNQTGKRAGNLQIDSDSH
jgi:hypothetical protein